MPFPYSHVCDLLQDLEVNHRKPAKKQVPPRNIVKLWFEQHRTRLTPDETDPGAVLSTLLPERRTDRVYCIQAATLENIFVKVLILGTSRQKELNRYTQPGSGLDLADCVEGILNNTPLVGVSTATVEEIDATLSQIAAGCRFSSPAVQKLPSTKDREGSLRNIYRRLSPRDSKWFTRLVLKNYEPIVMDSQDAFRYYHYLLPQMMKIQDSMSAASDFLRQAYVLPRNSDALVALLRPRIGTKVGRQPWFKGRSIQNCMNMARGRTVICEQKMDGEYCQIHIDLSKRSRCIQIFSKSGKDSTMDRKGLHEAIRSSLRIGRDDCPLRQNCVLEGELLVYSDKENQILPFHKIRKHVSRSGKFLGTDNDSQAHDYEHLMILYYDVLMIDGESLLGLKNTDRFQRLANIITRRTGHAELVSRTMLHTSRSNAAAEFREIFAKCILSRSEGLVLKPDEPYFDVTRGSGPYRCCNFKVKKEYFTGFGDVGDFAVVGASYNPAKARQHNIPRLKWTNFFIGCLENRDQARAKTEKPRFRITNVVELSGEVLRSFWALSCPSWRSLDHNETMILDFSQESSGNRPAIIFTEPLVFDMRCFAFDKAPNTNFWSMRFPYVTKIHYDRSYLDTVSFVELQSIAEEALIPRDEDSQEMEQWILKLEKQDGQRGSRDPASQASTESVSLPSPTSSMSSQRTRPRHSVLPTPPVSSDFDIPSSQESATRRMSQSQMKRSKQCVNAGSVDRQPDQIQAHAGRQEEHTAFPNKRRRTSAESSSIHSASQQTPVVRQSERPSHREPLSQTDPNDTGKHAVASEDESLVPETEKQDKTHSPAGTCSIAGAACLLANRSVLISPCIAGDNVTTELLRQHGITDPLTDPLMWKHMEGGQTPSSSFPSSLTDVDGENTPRPRPVRKICLVESKRKEAMEAFLKKIGDADLKRKGAHEWVNVYDWRVLETITKEEKTVRSRDPWRVFHIGIV